MIRGYSIDDQVYVLVPERPDTAALIRDAGYRWIKPWTNAPVTPANAPQVLEEAERALRACPERASFVHAYRANALRLLGRQEEARAAARLIPRVLNLWHTDYY